MNKLSLFSGIGGLDLAAKWAGFETVAFVEQNPFCQQVLGKHWPNVPIISDIREVTAERLTREGINVNAIKLISGGFPCQPFSNAGKRRGTEDNRYLWPEMLRVIREIKPAYVVGENVYGLVSNQGGMVLERIIADLENEGYEVSPPIVFPAAAVNAPHRRDRVWICAHSRHDNRGAEQGQQQEEWAEVVDGSGTHAVEGVARTNNNKGSQRWSVQSERAGQQPARSSGLGNAARELSHRSGASGAGWWDGSTNPGPHPVTEFDGQDREIERDFRGVAYGVSRRVDRLKALGNAVVPQQAFPIFAAIAAIEKSLG